MLAVILICGAGAVLTACKGGKQSAGESGDETAEHKKIVRSWYGENKAITDGNYDTSLAVKCVNGTFVGKKVDNTIVFRGIPYVGKQPVGSLRWKAPVDVVPCDSVYEAYYNAKSACQPEAELSSLYYQDENCLYLNVWKPARKSEEKTMVGTHRQPVIVWIHGGTYEYGGTVDPLYDFHNFVEENPDVIIVSVAYRLGVLGFLHLSHLPDGKDFPDAQNLGLMDQLMALKWVHENIAAFGGDPDNVTLMGESAGGGSVTNLSLVKGSHQYFNKVIALSGTPGSYTYYFTVESALPMMKSAHGMALAPLFKHPELDGDTGRAFDETFSKTMRKMWVQFAKTGNPSLSADLSPDGKAKEWPLYDLRDKRVMVLDEFNIHSEKESQIKITDWERTYFLSKYYSF